MLPVDSLLSWLGIASVRCSLLILLIWGFQLMLRSRMPSKWRLLLWLPVLFVMAAPLLPECGWSIDRWFTNRPPQTELCCPSSPEDCALPIDVVGADFATNETSWGWSIIAACWLTGASWFLGVVAWSYLRALRKIRRHALPVSQFIEALVAKATASLSLRRVPRILVTSNATSPAVTGMIRPVLVLPAGFPGTLDRGEAMLVLKHELLHIRMGDLWMSWLLCLLQAVHWFNPLVWFAFKQIRLDCEQARDEGVLDREEEGGRRAYGNALIKIASSFGAPKIELGILHMAASLGALQARVLAVARYRRPRRVWGFVGVVLICSVAVLGATRSPVPLPPNLSSGRSQHNSGAATAQHIFLARFDLHGASISEALTRLQSQAVAADGRGRGVRIWLTPEGARAARQAKIHLALRNVSAWQALVAITSQANLGIDGSGELLCVKWPFVTRSWELDEEKLHRLGFVGGNDLQAWLSGHGIKFPTGSIAFVSPAVPMDDGRRQVRLFVRNSQENLQRITILFSNTPFERPLAPTDFHL